MAYSGTVAVPDYKIETFNSRCTKIGRVPVYTPFFHTFSSGAVQFSAPAIELIFRSSACEGEME